MRHYILQHPIDGEPVSLMPFSYVKLANAHSYIAKCVIAELEEAGYCAGYGTFYGTKEQAEELIHDMEKVKE